MVELVLQAGAPGSLSTERRDALRLRIMSQLGAQAHAPVRVGVITVNERWVAIPAGLGLAAAIAAAVVLAQKPADTTVTSLAARGTGDLLVNGLAASEAKSGDLIVARSAAWLSIGPDAHVGLSESTALTFEQGPDGVVISPQFGELTLVTNAEPLLLRRDGLVAAMDAGTVARFSLLVGGDTLVTVDEGQVVVTSAGANYTVRAPHSRTFHKNGPPAAEADATQPPPSSPSPAQSEPAEGTDGDSAASQAPGRSGESHGNGARNASPATGEIPSTPADASSADHSAHGEDAPGNSSNAGAPANPSSSHSNANGATGPATKPGGQGQSPAHAANPGNTSAEVPGVADTVPGDSSVPGVVSDATPPAEPVPPGQAHEPGTPANPVPNPNAGSPFGSESSESAAVPDQPVDLPPDPVPGVDGGNDQGNAYRSSNGNANGAANGNAYGVGNGNGDGAANDNANGAVNANGNGTTPRGIPG